MRALWLDVDTKKVMEVNPDGLEDFYDLIGCRTVDIVNRSIGGRRYDIICDDEGLFEKYPKISAIDDSGQVMLVGSLIIAGAANQQEDLSDLTDADIEHIKEHMIVLPTKMHPEGLLMLYRMQY